MNFRMCQYYETLFVFGESGDVCLCTIWVTHLLLLWSPWYVGCTQPILTTHKVQLGL